MKKNQKKEEKICFVLYTLTSLIFLFTGVSVLASEGMNNWTGITNTALAVTFGCIAYIYYKKYKSKK